MKTSIAKLTDNKAQKELKQFLAMGYVAAFIALFAFGFLAIVSLAFSARCLMLCRHEGNKNTTKIKQWQAASIVLFILSAVEFVFYLSA